MLPSNDQVLSFANLPLEVLDLIFERCFLDEEDEVITFDVAQVCRKWRVAADKWATVYPPPPSGTEDVDSHDRDFGYCWEDMEDQFDEQA